jgi:hypothetical protein
MFDSRLHEYWQPPQTERSRALVERMCVSWRAEARHELEVGRTRGGELGAVAARNDVKKTPMLGGDKQKGKN